MDVSKFLKMQQTSDDLAKDIMNMRECQDRLNKMIIDAYKEIDPDMTPLLRFQIESYAGAHNRGFRLLDHLSQPGNSLVYIDQHDNIEGRITEGLHVKEFKDYSLLAITTDNGEAVINSRFADALLQYLSHKDYLRLDHHAMIPFLGIDVTGKGVSLPEKLEASLDGNKLSVQYFFVGDKPTYTLKIEPSDVRLPLPYIRLSAHEIIM